MSTRQFTVILEQAPEGGFAVHCPTLKGCWSQGDTEENALENIKDAIKVYLETLRIITANRKAYEVEVAV